MEAREKLDIRQRVEPKNMKPAFSMAATPCR